MKKQINPKYVVKCFDCNQVFISIDHYDDKYPMCPDCVRAEKKYKYMAEYIDLVCDTV